MAGMESMGMVSYTSKTWFPCSLYHSIYSIPAIIMSRLPLSSLHWFTVESVSLKVDFHQSFAVLPTGQRVAAVCCRSVVHYRHNWTVSLHTFPLSPAETPSSHRLGCGLLVDETLILYFVCYLLCYSTFSFIHDTLWMINLPVWQSLASIQ